MSNRRLPKTSRDCVVMLAPSVQKHLAPLRCPDCDSEFGPVRFDEHGVMRLELQHDATCPWLAARRAS